MGSRRPGFFQGKEVRGSSARGWGGDGGEDTLFDSVKHVGRLSKQNLD